jgi:transcription factor IIIB 90 kDa subunit
MRCPTCGSEETVGGVGGSVCCVCATVIDETNIVSEITFHEGSDGAAAVGGFVCRGSGVSGLPRHLTGESRMQSLERAKTLITQIATQLDLYGNFIDAAHRIYTLAAQHNFVRRRKSEGVCGCCLYVVCRQEGTPHMLLDFADALRINAFTLGYTFLRLCQLLRLRLPVIDPALYIRRFASELELGEKRDAIATTALRLVGQMKRDWMSTGISSLLLFTFTFYFYFLLLLFTFTFTFTSCHSIIKINKSLPQDVHQQVCVELHFLFQLVFIHVNEHNAKYRKLFVCVLLQLHAG